MKDTFPVWCHKTSDLWKEIPPKMNTWEDRCRWPLLSEESARALFLDRLWDRILSTLGDRT